MAAEQETSMDVASIVFFRTQWNFNIKNNIKMVMKMFFDLLWLVLH